MVLNIKRDIQADPARFDRDMKRRGAEIRSHDILPLHTNYLQLKSEAEKASMELNALSKKFDPSKKDLCKQISEKAEDLTRKAKEALDEVEQVLYSIPNLLDPAVPSGESDADNPVLEYFGSKPNIANPAHHEDLAIKMGLFHRDEAVSMSGSRFVITSGKLAKLERALVQFGLKFLEEKGFEELSVPFIVKHDAMKNTGQLSKFTSDQFFAFDDKCLIPTGEVPLVSYFKGKALTKSARVCTATPCFRKEAGSLGRDTKGLIRLHQFTKIEMVAITSPQKSHAIHQELLQNVKDMLDKFNLHYRVIEVCSGDIGFTALRQFDVEVWFPGQDKYVEVASCSNCGDYQAQRMGLKYVTSDGKKEFAHTLNSTLIACGRIMAAIIENHCYDGVLRLPEFLKITH